MADQLPAFGLSQNGAFPESWRHGAHVERSEEFLGHFEESLRRVALPDAAIRLEFLRERLT